jgi:hypothetical protein
MTLGCGTHCSLHRDGDIDAALEDTLSGKTLP